MGDPCQICGDVGYSHLLASCSTCLKSHEHIYCMPVLRSEVPDIWHCEACQLQKDILLLESDTKFRNDSMPISFGRVNEKATERMAQVDTLHSVRSSMFAGNMHSSGKKKKTQGTDAVTSPKDKLAAPSLSRNNSASKRVETGKVKFLPAKDVLRLKAGGSPKESTIAPGSQACFFGASHCPPSRRNSTVLLITSPRSAHQKGSTHGSPGHSKPLTAASLQASTHKSILQSQASFSSQKSLLALESLRKKRKIEEDRPEDRIGISGATIKEKFDEPRLLKFGKSTEDHIGISGATIKEKFDEPRLLKFGKSTGKEISVIPSRFLGKDSPVDGFLHTPIGISNFKLSSQFGEESLNPPAIKATWKGSFEIVDKDCPGELYDGFWAHPPGKISRKAYEVSKRMPEILRFKLHPRCDLWPDIFHKDGPSGTDIALYFFPGNFARFNEKYVCLLELIEKRDLMMQSCMDGVELLIFSSKQLTVDSQCLKVQKYMWGVFRSVKVSSPSLKLNKHESHAPSVKTRNVRHPMNATYGHELDTVKDMEIDMMGGKDTGRVDKPLKRHNTSERNEFQLKLHADSEKFRTSNTSSRWRKLNESHERGVKGFVDHIVGSSQNVPFKIHAKKQLESAAQEHFRDVKWGQRMARATVSRHSTVVKDRLNSPRAVGSSQYVAFKTHAKKQIESTSQEHSRDAKRGQRMERATASQHLTVVKEHVDSPHAVESSQKMPSKVHAQNQIESTAQEHLRYVMREQRMERAAASHHLTVVKKEHLDSPPGFLKKVTSVAAQKDDRGKLPLKIPSSPCFPKFPPGFSKPIVLKERSYSGGLPFKNENPTTVSVNSRRSLGSQPRWNVKDCKY